MKNEEKKYYNYGLAVGSKESYNVIQRLIYLMTENKVAYKDQILDMLLRISFANNIKIPTDLDDVIVTRYSFIIAMGLQNANVEKLKC
ncbi:hypothetical protein U729_3166 (plasmid) [Clostridium baratii str. Sullivan]|uniref:Uncharacterized protein n=1 Tax=Clostridium baratii str. Sullivan TaxID=1415775 RepID=A0A0A7G330_9CLOT|nr:hypothetical protein [Clostridium baratii]AIY85386.1 hypothetical protein U729_3166 [Clostridium baratii str. Sullivan]